MLLAIPEHCSLRMIDILLLSHLEEDFTKHIIHKQSHDVLDASLSELYDWSTSTMTKCCMDRPLLPEVESGSESA